MISYPFRQVDVFGSAAYTGNPLAVVAAADEVTDEDMRRFARWTNLSETAFLLRPTTDEADYRVRIFTPSVELPFAGHPTLGSAHAWLASGGRPARDGVVVQECAAGLVRVRVSGDRFAFAAPPMTRFEPVDEALAARVAAVLGVERQDVVGCSWLVNGPEWIGVRLADAERVLALAPDPVGLAGLDVGVIGPHRGGDADFEVRAFTGTEGSLVEDPATGSLNAGFARWLIEEGAAPRAYVAAQGTAMGRAARLHVDLDDDGLWVGGDVRSGITGTVDL